MAEHDARRRLELEVRERPELGLGEPADLGLRELDVGAQLLRDLLGGRRDLVGADAEVLGVPVVEAARVLAHRLLAAALDVGEHVRHDAADVAAGGAARVLVWALPVLDPGG